MNIYLLAFGIVFLVNILPAFAPPTWIVLSFLAFNYSVPNIFLFVIIGVVAATVGRVILAHSSHFFLRNHWLSARSQHNIDYLKKYLEHKKKVTFSIFFFDAFTPIPSNQFFIAYGLTGLPLVYALVPFVLGRIVSYGFWAFTSTKLAQSAAAQSLTNASFFGFSFIIVQIALLAVVYLFVHIDWKKLFTERKFSLLHN